MDSEQMIKDAGADKAPRIAPTTVEQAIVSEHYFTAFEGACGAGQVAPDDLPAPLKLLTICVLVVDNGFTVMGEAACASPENFNAELGRAFARRDATSKLGRLLGFRLRDALQMEADLAKPFKLADEVPVQGVVGLAPTVKVDSEGGTPD